MAFLDAVLGGGVGQLVKDVVGTFKLSPETKAELDKQIEEHDFELKKLDVDVEARLADIAGQNIRAEASSGDKYTSRARPTFLYVFCFIILWNYCAVPIFRQTPVQFPDSLMWLGGACVLGYTGARSWDKYAEKLLGGGGK
jgi:hypothetical protein